MSNLSREELVALNSVPFTPFHDYLLLKPLEEEKTNEHGFITTTGTSSNKPIKAIVVKVGTGRVELGNHIPLQSKLGDLVYVDKYQSTEVVVEGEKFILVRENSVFGSFNKINK